MLEKVALILSIFTPIIAGAWMVLNQINKLENTLLKRDMQIEYKIRDLETKIQKLENLIHKILCDLGETKYCDINKL